MPKRWGKVQGKAFFDSARQDPVAYYGDWAVYNEAGINGIEVNGVQPKYGDGLNMNQRRAAYPAGQVDAGVLSISYPQRGGYC